VHKSILKGFAQQIPLWPVLGFTSVIYVTRPGKVLRASWFLLCNR